MFARFVRFGRSVALASLAVLAGAALLAATGLVVSLTVSARTIDEATDDALALSTMKVALAEETQHVAVWVAGRPSGGAPSVVDAVAGPRLRFTTAAQTLLAGESIGDERDRYLAVEADHEELIDSIRGLEDVAASGGDVEPIYVAGHRTIEEGLASQLAALEATTSTRVELALLDFAAARDRLASLLPVIMLAAIAALYTLWRLRLARRRADSLQRLIVEKDVFIGTVSHELRTPLTGILGLTSELVENGESFSPEQRAQYREVVFAQALEMRDLIEDLLVAARTDIENIGIRLTELDLADVVRKVLTESALMQSAEAPAVAVGDGTVHVRADRMRFRQILRNLLSNACRYGGPRVSIGFDTRDGSGIVSVRDDGNGVPPGSEDLIFEPYHSAAGEGRPMASVGLGLSVSRTLARLMGGDLVYRREEGETVFEVSLPLVAVAAPGELADAGLSSRV